MQIYRSNINLNEMHNKFSPRANCNTKILNINSSVENNKELEVKNIQSILESSISNIEWWSRAESLVYSPRDEYVTKRPKTSLKVFQSHLKAGPLALNEPSDNRNELNRFRITVDKTLAPQGYASRNGNIGTRNVHFLTQLSPVDTMKNSIQNLSKNNPLALADITKQKLNNANWKKFDGIPGKILSKQKQKKLKKSKSRGKNMFIPANKINKNLKVLVKVGSNKNLLSNTIKTSSSWASLARKSPKSVRNSENAQFKFPKNIVTLKDNLENVEISKKKISNK